MDTAESNHSYLSKLVDEFPVEGALRKLYDITHNCYCPCHKMEDCEYDHNVEFGFEFNSEPGDLCICTKWCPNSPSHDPTECIAQYEKVRTALTDHTKYLREFAWVIENHSDAKEGLFGSISRSHNPVYLYFIQRVLRFKENMYTCLSDVAYFSPLMAPNVNKFMMDFAKAYSTV